MEIFPTDLPELSKSKFWRKKRRKTNILEVNCFFPIFFFTTIKFLAYTCDQTGIDGA